MPLEQSGAPPNAARPPTDLNAWMSLLPPRAGHGPAQAPVPAPAPAPAPTPAPVTGYAPHSAAARSVVYPPAEFPSRGGHDDSQNGDSQKLLVNRGHRPPSSALPPTTQASHTHLRNGHGTGFWRSALPAHDAPRHSLTKPRGAPASPSITTRPISQSAPRFRQPAAGNSSAMDIDELANSDGNEESDTLPLVLSDLDPRYGKATTPPPKKSPTQPTQPKFTPNLSIRHSNIPHTLNGIVNKTASTTPLTRPVVTIPISSPAPTPIRRESAVTVSVSLPALYTPKKHENTTSGRAAYPADASDPLPVLAKVKSPVIAVGRRSKPAASDVRSFKNKGGRPKGWKPGMSYREVALRNAGIEPNDPSLPPEVLLPPRARKQGRPPGRPRLPGRPKVISSHSQGYKRAGRPPLQSIEAVQRSIFLAGEACFAPFVCEWAGCRAELQNMATLRRHVAFIHGQPLSAAKTCQWRRCATRVPAVQYKDAADTDADGRTFLEHVEHQHLTPLSWHRGDGFANTGHIGGPPLPPSAAAILARSRVRDEGKPKTEDGAKGRATEALAVSADNRTSASMALELSLDGIPTEDLPRYLLDDKGRQVTPLLRDTVLESSPIFWTQEERGRRLKELYRHCQQNLNKRPDRSLGRIL